jgi:hypothetical protein
MDIYLALGGDYAPMAWILHWKATAAMTAVFVAIAVPATLFVHDANLAVVILVAAFGLVLLSGNIFLRSAARTGKAEPFQGVHLVQGGAPHDPGFGRR